MPETSPKTNFLGTTDNEPMEIHVYGLRGLRLDYASDLGALATVGATSMNVNGGYWRQLDLQHSGGGDDCRGRRIHQRRP